jgi:Tol biopolymer transport system component
MHGMKLLTVSSINKSNLIFIFVVFVFLSYCSRKPLLEEKKGIILCRDANCYVLGINFSEKSSKVLIKSRKMECITSPTWVSESEFVYYIYPLYGTPSTINPLILVNVETGKQKMIYKGKHRLREFARFSSAEIMMQLYFPSTKVLLLDIKTGEERELFYLYPRIDFIRHFSKLPSQNLIAIQGINAVKSKDLPRTLRGSINFDSDSLDDLYLYDIREDKLTQLTDTRWSDIHPVWSPDGKYIAFSSNKQGNYDIYVMELESREVTQLTTDKSIDQYPEYSPDGSKIAFISDRNGEDQVWLMDSDGSNPKQLTEIEVGVGGPLSWNPKK